MLGFGLLARGRGGNIVDLGVANDVALGTPAGGAALTLAGASALTGATVTPSVVSTIDTCTLSDIPFKSICPLNVMQPPKAGYVCQKYTLNGIVSRFTRL